MSSSSPRFRRGSSIEASHRSVDPGEEWFERTLDGIAREITERKTAEAEQERAATALRASEERYQMLFERHPHPLWLFDRETLRFLMVNEAAVRHYGYSREEFLTLTIEAIRPPAEVASLRQALQQPQAGREAPVVWRHQKKDGTLVDMEITAHDLDFLGRSARLVSAVDVTERKRAEAALLVRGRQQEAVAWLGQQVLEARDLGSLFELTVSLVGRTLDVPYCELLELTRDAQSLLLRAGQGWREDCIGRARVGRGADSQAGYTLDQNAAVIVGDLRSETRFRSSALLLEHGVRSGMSVVIPGKPGPFGVLGTHSDSLRTFTQDDIHFLQAVAHILGTAIERDRADTALRVTQRLESVGRLAGGVAHDFNNLLTAITGYADLLLQNLQVGDPMGEDIEEIRKAALRAASLTRQLLAFSRRQVLEPRPLDLNEVVKDMEKMLGRLIGEDIQFQTALRPNLGIVRADPGQMEQVILNLVVNARDAMPEGGKLTVETAVAELDQSYADQHNAVRPGQYVMLAVSDTGIGMDQEIQSRIFEPFFTTKGPEQGTGLGLSTVYGIVKQSGGNVWVYSEPGQGTTFRLYLPLVQEEAPLTRVGEPGSPSLCGSETVLLAEDEHTVRRLAERILKQAGYQVLVARNGAEALLVSERHAGPIHLLVSDIVMPQMSGGELAGRLRDIRPDMRLLYLSGYADPGIVEQELLEGNAAFLHKPFSADGLMRKVRDVLARRA